MLQRLLHAISCLLACLLPAMPAAAQGKWPEVALPETVRSYPIGPQMDLNGMPMRVTGFASTASTAQMADWFHRALGQPLTDNRLGSQRILGRAQGEHYITIRLEAGADGHGTRGLLAITHLRAALQGQQRHLQDTARWQRMLPAGTEVSSLLKSQDNGRLSTHLVATNRHTVQLNAQRLTDVLQEQGYVLESRFDSSAQAATPPHAQGTTLLLRAPGKEATALITRDMQAGYAMQSTRIVLITSIQLERLQ